MRCRVGAVAPRQRTSASSPSSSRRSVARWSSSSAIEIGLCPMIRIAVLPEPIPQNTRPGAIRLIVACAAAVTAAGREPATATPVPMPMRDVRAASSAIDRVAVRPDHLAVGHPQVAEARAPRRAPRSRCRRCRPRRTPRCPSDGDRTAQRVHARRPRVVREHGAVDELGGELDNDERRPAARTGRSPRARASPTCWPRRAPRWRRPRCSRVAAAAARARVATATTSSPSRRSGPATRSPRCCAPTSAGSATRVHPWGRSEILALHRLSHRRRQAAARGGRRGRRAGQPDRPQPRRDLRPRGRPRRARARPPGDHRRQPVRRRPQVERGVADVRVGHRHPHHAASRPRCWPG